MGGEVWVGNMGGWAKFMFPYPLTPATIESAASFMAAAWLADTHLSSTPPAFPLRWTSWAMATPSAGVLAT